jgi:hypothetical protein
MKMLLNLLSLSAAALASVPAAHAQAPTVDTLKQVLNQRLQKLRPDGSTERNILFQEVRAGNASGGDYPFQSRRSFAITAPDIRRTASMARRASAGWTSEYSECHAMTSGNGKWRAP